MNNFSIVVNKTVKAFSVVVTRAVGGGGSTDVNATNVGAAIDNFTIENAPAKTQYVALGGKKKTLISKLIALFKLDFDSLYAAIGHNHSGTYANYSGVEMIPPVGDYTPADVNYSKYAERATYADYDGSGNDVVNTYATIEGLLTKQDLSDPTLETVDTTIVGAINELKARVDENPRKLSFTNIQDLVTAFNGYAIDLYNIGQDAFISQLQYSDAWIYEKAGVSVPYTYTTDDEFEAALQSGLQIGFYILQPIEFKTNLENYYTKTEIETNFANETQSTIKDKLGAATSLVDGYLTLADWATFNGKQAVPATIGSQSSLDSKIALNTYYCTIGSPTNVPNNNPVFALQVMKAGSEYIQVAYLQDKSIYSRISVSNSFAGIAWSLVADPLRIAGIIQSEDAASSGTIAIAPNTVKILTTTLTNANTAVITPTAPTAFLNQQEATIVVTVGATAPTLTFTPPASVTFVWMDKAAPSALTINKTYTFVFFWINATTCQVFHAIKA